MDNDTALKAVLGEFGVSNVNNISQVYKSTWNVDDQYILKKTTSLDELNKSIWFSQYLAGKNISVKTYYKTKAGSYYVEIEGYIYCLTNRINGDHINAIQGNCRETGIDVGEIIARLHQALADMKPPFEIYDSSYKNELDGWILGNIREKQVSISHTIIQECKDLEPLYLRLPRQIIHRDMHLGNLIFDSGVFQGYIDFDISQINARILDVCYMGTTSFAYINRNSQEDLDKWGDFFTGVLLGYDRISNITEDEKKAIPSIFVLIELTFTAWFAREGNEEIVSNAAMMTEWLFHHRPFMLGIISRFEKE